MIIRKISLILIWFTLNNTVIAQEAPTQAIAHRGAWKTNGLPQNSLAALHKAIELGCYGAEFDVHLTKDDVLVVNHDRDFYGMVIEDATYGELLAKRHPNGEQIPTAEEYIREGMKQKKTKLIFELKTSSKGKERTQEAVRKSVELVKKLKAKKHVEYICFDFDAGRLIKELDGKAEVAYLNGDKTPAEAKAAGYTGIDYQFNIYEQKPTWIQEAKALGLKINGWTVNDEKDMKMLIGQKIDFITTDEPEKLLKLLAE